MGQLQHQSPNWRVLDSHFACGSTFFQTWLTWRLDSKRASLLHYVAICESACSSAELEALAQSQPQFSDLIQQLLPHWWGLLPGFHRISLDQGRVLLTLCVGPALAMLKAQQFEADEVIFHPFQIPEAELPWTLKSLARCCRRGTALHLLPSDQNNPELGSPLHNALTQSGFQKNASSADPHWQFAPPWTRKTSRGNSSHAAGRCAVIGAGLAGASVASALARRAWQVQVLDRAESPAAGASGLPVGLVVPHVSRDDCVLSRLSRCGVRMMLEEARALLQQGQQWDASGVLERQINKTPQLPPHWPGAGLDWSQDMADTRVCNSIGPGLWHAHAAWIKPAALVEAWLGQAGIEFQGGSQVAALRRNADRWELLDPSGRCITQADQVVLANAAGAFELLAQLQQSGHRLQGLQAKLLKVQAMRGALSWALHSSTSLADQSPAFPAFPVNGSGSLIPDIALPQGRAWLMGSTYQDAIEPERSDADNQAINLAHLQDLLPALAEQLAPSFQPGRSELWKGVRCVSVDRLPVVGPLQVDGHSGLWLCAAMGSRGLSFSVLCAELLAARMAHEPLPVESRLAQALDVMRGK